MLIHLDTDIGGNPDDARALIMLLGWSGVELVAVTTTHDPYGRRSGCASLLATMAGRADLPIVAGAAGPLDQPAARQPRLALTDEDPRYWPERPTPRPSPPGAATARLADSVAAGACLVAIGPLTNLATLELARPGTLADTHVVVCGGWPTPDPSGDWPTPDPSGDWPTPAADRPGSRLGSYRRDTNIQADPRAAQIVATAAGFLTFVPLPAVAGVRLWASDVAWLRKSVGAPLGTLLARQAEAWAYDKAVPYDKAASYDTPGSSGRALGYQFDPVTAAVAAVLPASSPHSDSPNARAELPPPRPSTSHPSRRPRAGVAPLGITVDEPAEVSVDPATGALLVSGLVAGPAPPEIASDQPSPAAAAVGPPRPLRAQATRVVTAVNPAAFTAAWRAAVLAATRSTSR